MFLKYGFIIFINMYFNRFNMYFLCYKSKGMIKTFEINNCDY